VSARHAVTEADVREAAKSGGSLVVGPRTVVTPAARDLARQLGVDLQRSRTPGAGPSARTEGTAPGSRLRVVALGADHGGFPMKEQLKSAIEAQGYAVLDVGTHSGDAVDYPDFAVAVARAVAEGRAWRGVMVDGAGIGSAMAANKVPGVRAALCYDLTTAHNAREHNDANLLTLGGTLIGSRLALDIVSTFLATAFGGGRHQPRVDKINQLDRR